VAAPLPSQPRQRPLRLGHPLADHPEGKCPSHAIILRINLYGVVERVTLYIVRGTGFRAIID